MKIKKIRKKRGMTMIELLMVLVIVGSIIAILITTLTKNQERAGSKLNKLKMQMDWANINTAILEYSRVYGGYPDPSIGLEALVNPPESENGNPVSSFIDRESILDQWKRVYHYEVVDGRYKVISLGADGTVGGDGPNADVDLGAIN
jgi:general secretion pathway protein G